MKKITKLLFLGMVFVFAACGSQTGFTPNEYAFSEIREIEGVMVYAADMAFHGKVVTPGLSPALQTAGDTTYFVYQHFDEDYPCTICSENICFLDTVRVLARTAKAKDYNGSVYYCADIVEILEIRPASVEW